MKASERHRVTDTPAASGLGLVKREGRVIVEGIQEGSPAAKAGIVKGDEVLSIDDRKAGECAIIVLGRLLRGEGRTVRIEVRHGEVVREVAVRLDLAWRTAKQGP
jgi:S1-C subfamily serine protease